MAFDEVISEPEQWANRVIRLPLIDKGLPINAFYWNNLPANLINNAEARPREYVVCDPNSDKRLGEFSDNKLNSREAFIQCIVQCRVENGEEKSEEIAYFIESKIIEELERYGNVRTLTNTSFGYDEQTNLITRTVSCWVRY